MFVVAYRASRQKRNSNQSNANATTERIDRRVGHVSRRWLATIAFVAVAVPSHTVLGGDTLQRTGRIFGFGWGDGYQACRDSGVRLGADLPPRDVANPPGCRSRCVSLPIHQAGQTFYDRFDAANRNASPRSCPTCASPVAPSLPPAGCDGSMPCDGPGICDSPGITVDCDQAPANLIDGANVMSQPEQLQKERARQTARTMSTHVRAVPHRSASIEQLNRRDVRAGEVQDVIARPTRITPPTFNPTTHSSSTKPMDSVARSRAYRGFAITAEDLANRAQSTGGQRRGSRSGPTTMVAKPSTTPEAIVPRHPWDSPQTQPSPPVDRTADRARPDRLVAGSVRSIAEPGLAIHAESQRPRPKRLGALPTERAEPQSTSARGKYAVPVVAHNQGAYFFGEPNVQIEFARQPTRLGANSIVEHGMVAPSKIELREVSKASEHVVRQPDSVIR